MELVFSSWEHVALTENHIEQLHRNLLQFSTKNERHPRHYKTTTNHVGAFHGHGNLVAVIFETATPYDTPRLMTELWAWYNHEQIEKTIHPVIAVAVFIVVFLEIHPFKDGNGRLSRALTTLLLLLAGYAYVPYSSLEAVIEQ
jgi:Fic family protein